MYKQKSDFLYNKLFAIVFLLDIVNEKSLIIKFFH